MIEAEQRSPSRTLPIVKVLAIGLGLLLTNHQVLARLDYFVSFGQHFPLLVFVGIWSVSLAAILYLAFTPRTAERVAWAVVICVAVFLGETYYRVAGDHMSIGALDAMWDPGLFTPDIVAFYGRYFLDALARTSPLLVGLLVPFPVVKILGWRGWMALPFVPLALLGGLVFYVGASQGRETSGMPSQFLLPSLLGTYALSSPPSLERAPVEIPVTRPSGLDYVVLIVDESVSGDFIDLNVPRDTTPFLVSQAESLVNFGIATSANNCSNASNAILRMGADPDLLGDGDHQILSNPTIWKYAERAGFETHFVEGQDISGARKNFMYGSEVALIDHVETYPRDVERYRRDEVMSDRVREILARPGPQFVLFNKYGVHFPYHLAHPEDEAPFQPSMQAFETVVDRERMVNGYKNGIRWAVDRFFENLLAGIDLSNGVILYTSDHGQNLLEDGNPTTHCRRRQERPHEAVVPLLVWTGNEELRRRFERAAELNRGAASHFEIFPTLLELFGYDPQMVAQRYHQSLFEKIEAPLGFTSGPVMGRFGRGAVWIPREGIERLER